VVPIEPEHHVVDPLDQGAEPLLAGLDGRERRGPLGQQQLIGRERRRALEGGGQEAADESNGVDVEIVECSGPRGPDGHHRLYAMLGAR
jgi:hypothetical protein